MNKLVIEDVVDAVAKPFYLEFVRDCFEEMYPFGDTDSTIMEAVLDIVQILTYGKRQWFVVNVHQPSKKPAEYIYPRFTPDEEKLYVEGAAGMGKSTLLGDYTGGDLQEIRDSPLGLLSGIGEVFGFFRSRLRNNKARIVDRSDWVAPMVYSAYANSVLFLFNGNCRKFIKTASPGRVVILDEPSITDEELCLRIQMRGKMDKNAPLEYTNVTRHFFRVIAKHYDLPIVNVNELKVLINSFAQ